MEEIDVVVVGAGVVGLACARALALAGREVLLVEAEAGIGTGTSSRNSEVIHAGIYYPPGTLKALHCVRGRELLYAYCAERVIGHRRCCKLIVATAAEQVPKLAVLKDTAARNGVADLEFLSSSQACGLEPQLRCVAALASPSSGIVDSHALMLAYQGDLEGAGGLCVFNTRIARASCSADGVIVHTTGKEEALSLRARLLVNCAGLHAQQLAHQMEGFPAHHVPPTYYAKGNYFSLAGRAPFSRLIYPVPEEAGLGVHLTLDLGMQARFGPDVQWVDEPDYDVDPGRGAVFYAEIRKYWPGLRDGALQPAYAGIRPKIQAPGEPALDFRIDGPETHGVPGVINLFGIESPGLTASLSIAALVAEMAAA
ncbi:MAG TPA: NAD(P)/FAD-dependent oxidoreductase [Lautropia sp.]|nr:NAD(P)/FAD-dependent oxidoreductase [Lautropia sp.]